MSHELLLYTSFFLFLLLIDRDIAAKAHLVRCPHCGGVLDVANFHRKPRGSLCCQPAGFDVRFSLCCRVDGCRRRRTPPSVRFLDRRVYLGIVTVIVATMQHGASQFRLKQLQTTLKVDYHTIHSWIGFWGKLFPTTDRGRRTRSWFPDGGSSTDLLSMLWKKLCPAVGAPIDIGIAVLRMLAMVMTDGHWLDEKIIKQLAAIAYAQETPTDA